MKINREILCGTSHFMSFPCDGEYLQVNESPKREPTMIDRHGVVSTEQGWIEFLDSKNLGIVL